MQHDLVSGFGEFWKYSFDVSKSSSVFCDCQWSWERKMRTRRSTQSFGIVSPKKRRRSGRKWNNKMNKKGVPNETILISDSEPEADENEKVGRNIEDDIEVIDLESSQEQGDEDQDTVLVNPQDISSTSRSEGELSQTKLSPCRTSMASRSEGELSTTTLSVVGASTSSPPVTSARNQSPTAAPVVTITIDEDSQARSVVPVDEDDEVQCLGFKVSALGRKSKGRKSSSGGVASRKSNGSLQIMQGSIRKAKDTMRRKSLTNSMTESSEPGRYNSLWNGMPLNSISNNSKGIRKPKGKKKFQRGFGNPIRPGQLYNPMYRNRDREFTRDLLLRVETDQVRNPNYVPLGPNPFIQAQFNPVPGCSKSSNNLHRRDRTTWIPRRNFQGRKAPRIASIPVGSNIMHASDSGNATNREPGTLRPIVIDGSNVAVGHGELLVSGGGQKFSPRGIQICVDYFKKRGHTEVIAFVPHFRLKQNESLDPPLMEKLKKDYIRFTPSRVAGAQRISSYDDLFVVQYAHDTGGIIVSNDNFRDIFESNPDLRDTITNRQLMFTWVTPDIIMFPQDPLGPTGQTLDDFLKFPPG